MATGGYPQVPADQGIGCRSLRAVGLARSISDTTGLRSHATCRVGQPHTLQRKQDDI